MYKRQQDTLGFIVMTTIRMLSKGIERKSLFL